MEISLSQTWAYSAFAFKNLGMFCQIHKISSFNHRKVFSKHAKFSNIPTFRTDLVVNVCSFSS